jgi:DNA-binding beta-propeller fold protein YncE
MGLAPSKDGKRLYVSDLAKNGVFVFDFATKQVSLFGGELSNFKSPFGIAVDGKDHVYIVDSMARQIYVFDPQGKRLQTIAHESLERPTGIAVDSRRGKIYVADSASSKSSNHVIRVFDSVGNYLSAIGTQGQEAGKFFFPTYLALDTDGNLYVADTMNARVQVFDPDGKYLKTIGERGDGYGMFDKPKGVALDSFGNIYVVDSSWSNVQIFNQQGKALLFFAGRGRFPGLLFNPTGIAIDKANRIYVADTFNGRICRYQLVNTKVGDSMLANHKEE